METLTLEQQVSDHLKYNHLPPVNPEMVNPCIEAINAVKNGDENKMITIIYGHKREAHKLIEDLHLTDFIN